MKIIPQSEMDNAVKEALPHAMSITGKSELDDETQQVVLSLVAAYFAGIAADRKQECLSA